METIKKWIRHPLFVVLVYALFGFLWIIFSDRLLETMVTDISTLSRLQTWKGWFFILVTSLLLYVLVYQNLLLNRKHEQNRLLFMTSAPLPLVILQDNGTISLVNRSFIEAYGYTTDDIPTLNDWWEKASPDETYREEVLSHWRRGHNNGFEYDSTTGQEFSMVRKDGGTSLVRFILIHQLKSYIIICQDITKERELEDQLNQSEKMSAIGQLAGGIAHDFNNQLGIMTGCVELLSIDSELEESHSRKLLMLRTAIQNSVDLTSMLLRFSRKETLELKPLHIMQLLTDLCNVIEHTFPAQITLRQTIDTGDILINGDYSQLENAFLNLAINARDAMNSQGVLTIEAFARNNHVTIQFSDTGSGISVAHLPHIFEPFYTTKEKGKGTGMGLAILFTTIKHHGGTIAVQSHVGEGTTFTITLPVFDANLLSSHSV